MYMEVPAAEAGIALVWYNIVTVRQESVFPELRSLRADAVLQSAIHSQVILCVTELMWEYILAEDR